MGGSGVLLYFETMNDKLGRRLLFPPFKFLSALLIALFSGKNSPPCSSFYSLCETGQLELSH